MTTIIPQNNPAPSTKRNRIASVTLDSQSIVTSSTEIELERRRAIAGLIEEGEFALIQPAKEGPYTVHMSLEKGLLIMRVSCSDMPEGRVLAMTMSNIFQSLHDYRLMSDEFHRSARNGQIARMESIDAKRQALHEQATEILAQEFDQNIHMDRLTARRLFTLVYILHIKQSQNH